ncbi:MAG: lactate/malate family dehydrogenase [Candidatus Fervidibacter sp.]|uniref:lactate/malate family dehydrogenase n=1 Tax=Candidatus Fervidibacter sp. TaxID=3100871 RepID=UPI004049CE6B
MRVAVLGAGSDVGKVINHALILSDLLSEGDELVLIGRKEGKSAFIVKGMAEDFAEAFADKGVKIVPSIDLSDAWGDFLVFVASAPDPAHFTRIFHRERLAEDNCNLVKQILPTLKSNRDLIGWVIVVTNPNELVVRLLSESLETDRIVATGALVDSFRFRFELARDLNVDPRDVTAWVGGEHGPNMLFFWSLVRVDGKPLDESTVQKLRCPSREFFERRKGEAFELAEEVLGRDGLNSAYKALIPFPTEVRAIAKSYLTHTSGAKTGGVAAQAVLRLIKAVRSDHPVFLCAQTVSNVGTVGVPLTLSRNGLTVRIDTLSEDEQEALRKVGTIVREKVDRLIQTVS